MYKGGQSCQKGEQILTKVEENKPTWTINVHGRQVILLSNKFQ